MENQINVKKIIDEALSNFVIPPIEIKIPSCDVHFPPMVFGPAKLPSLISLSPPPPFTISVAFLDMKQSHQCEPTTEEKCKAILLRIVELINKGEKIGFEEDWGRWSATITKGNMHNHVGMPGPDGNFDIFVNNLYDLLVKGKGLSWA